MRKPIYNRGLTFSEMKRPAEALQDFEKAAALDPDIEYLPGARLLAKMQLADWSNLDAELAQIKTAIAAGKSISAPFTLLAPPLDAPTQLKFCTALCRG